MDNLKEMYYLLEVIIEQIFVFLRNLVVHEFPKLISSNSSNVSFVEVNQLKNQATPSVKNHYIDFAVCFILSSFVGVIIFLSVKGNKEDEDDDFTDKTSTSRVIDLPEDPIYHFPQNWNSNAAKHYGDRGDEYFSEEDESPRKEIHHQKKYKSRKNLSTPSVYGDYTDSSQYSPRTESIKSGMSRNHWLIRKTRSGHVYGKYPI